MAKHFKVTQLRSTIGCTESQIRTMEALGLRGRHKSILINDHPANRGQILKIQHLVEVEVLTGAIAAKVKPQARAPKAASAKVAAAKPAAKAAPKSKSHPTDAPQSKEQRS